MHTSPTPVAIHHSFQMKLFSLFTLSHTPRDSNKTRFSSPAAIWHSCKHFPAFTLTAKNVPHGPSNDFGAEQKSVPCVILQLMTRTHLMSKVASP